MATEQQLLKAANWLVENQGMKGDESFEKVASWYRDNRAPKDPSDQSYMGGLSRAALQGMTFGFSDEIGAAIAAIPASLATGETWDDVYGKMHDNLQKNRESFSRENPGAALTAEIGGALATGGAGFSRQLGGRAYQAASGAKKLGMSARAGAAEGAAYGAGTADRGERVEGAVQEGAWGAMLGPAAGKVAEVAGRAARGIGGAVKERLFEGAGDQARRTVQDFAQAGNLSADDAIRRMQELGPGATLADTDDSMRMLAKAGMSLTGDMQQRGRQMVTERQRYAGARLQDKLRNLTGERRKYGSKMANIVANRDRAAKPLYKQGWDQGVEPTSDLLEVLDRKGFMAEAKAHAVKLMETAGRDIEGRGLLRTVHYTKMALDGQIGTAFRAGDKTKAHSLLEAKRALLDAVRKQDPEHPYLRANEIYASHKAMENALDEGFMNFGKGTPELLEKMVKEMTPGEREMYRIGAISNLANRLDNMGNRTDKVEKLAGTNAMRARIRTLFDSDKQANDFMKFLDKEGEFVTTRQMFNQQSITAQLQAAQESLKKSADPGVIMRAAMGDPTGFISMAAKALQGPKATPEMLSQLGDIMLKQNMTPAEIKMIFGSTKFKAALGPEWDRLVAPWLRSWGGPTVAIGREEMQGDR